jgi:hypothetical protein
VPVDVGISAKYWSEWQDLNLRPLVPNEVRHQTALRYDFAHPMRIDDPAGPVRILFLQQPSAPLKILF